MKKFYLIALLLLLVGCTTEPPTVKENLTVKEEQTIDRREMAKIGAELSHPAMNKRGGKGKPFRAIKFEISNSGFQSRQQNQTNITTPIPYSEFLGAAYEYDHNTAELNGNTYTIYREIWNNVVTLNTWISVNGVPTLDVDVHMLRVQNVNGVDKLLYSEDTGVYEFDGVTSTLVVARNHDTPADVWSELNFLVYDIDQNGSDDMYIFYRSWDNKKGEIVWDFENNPNPVRNDVLFNAWNNRPLAFIEGDNNQLFLVTKGGVPTCGTTGYLYGISEVQTAPLPESTYDILSGFVVVDQPANANQINAIQFTGLPECTYFRFTVRGMNGEYIGYGVGGVRNVDDTGEGYFVLDRQNDDGTQTIAIAPGDYLAVFPEFGIEIPFTVN